MSNWVCPFGNSRMACASHTFSKSVCPIFQSRNNPLRQKAKFFPCERRLQPLPPEMRPAKHAKKLRGSHRGHRGNIKVLHIRPAPNFTVSLKIDLCDLCDLRVINSPIASATEPTSSS